VGRRGMFVVETSAAVHRFEFIEGYCRLEAARVFVLSRDTIAKISRYWAPSDAAGTKPPEKPKQGH
jgi:hypothetical protein